MSPRRPIFAPVLWLAAAACVWVPIVDNYLRWADSSFKRWTVVTSLPLTLLGALWAAKAARATRWRLLPALVLTVTVFVQCDQALLRSRYRASPPTRSLGPEASIWRPITTTDLVTHYFEISSDRLQVDRLRVAQISDLHVASALPAAYYERALDAVLAAKPDLIVLSGDLVSTPDGLPLLASVLGQRLRAPLGVFAVLGNHDYWTGPARVREILVRAGVTLAGPCLRLPERVGRVAVCGTEAPWGPDLRAPLDASTLNLVLSHTPDNVYPLADLGASVVFSGHTHGGQGRVPGLGAMVVPSRYGSRFDQGHFRVGPTDLFVSAGAGADSPPLRVYCPPDVIVVDIEHRGAASAAAGRSR